MGIDLHQRAIDDAQKIHNGELGTGGFDVEMIFTDLSGNSLAIRGLYNDVSVTIDSDTGQVITGAKVAVSFCQEDLTIWDGKADVQRWTVEFTNGAGQDITAEAWQVLPDRSFGDVVWLCKIVEGHR